jgi:hypothetical protein
MEQAKVAVVMPPPSPANGGVEAPSSQPTAATTTPFMVFGVLGFILVLAITASMQPSPPTPSSKQVISSPPAPSSEQVSSQPADVIVESQTWEKGVNAIVDLVIVNTETYDVRNVTATCAFYNYAEKQIASSSRNLSGVIRTGRSQFRNINFGPTDSQADAISCRISAFAKDGQAGIEQGMATLRPQGALGALNLFGTKLRSDGTVVGEIKNRGDRSVRRIRITCDFTKWESGSGAKEFTFDPVIPPDGDVQFVSEPLGKGRKGPPDAEEISCRIAGYN